MLGSLFRSMNVMAVSFVLAGSAAAWASDAAEPHGDDHSGGHHSGAEVLPHDVQEALKLSDEQKHEVEHLQKHVDAGLDKVLTVKQLQDLKQLHQGHGHGLPMNFTQDLALFSLVTFVVYLIVLRLGAWGPLKAGLNERERRIRQDIADAEANRVKSEQLITEREAKLAKVHEEVRELLAEARRDSDRVRHDIVTAAQTEAEATKNRAIAEIERSRDLALAELFDFVASNVVGATERVIGRSLNEGDHDRLVKQALADMNVRRN